MSDYPDSEREAFQELVDRADSFESSDSPEEDTAPSPDLEWAYGPLKNGVKSVVRGYSKLLMLDAAGGLGKTHQIKGVLRDELGPEGQDTGSYSQDTFGWLYKAGYTTPLALYESLWEARHGDVLFLDDMSGITTNDKCVEMLKAATDTQGPENMVTYESSSPPELGPHNREIETFNFEGKIIMSFNDTPSNRHFDALQDRSWLGSAYNLNFSYEDRLRLIEEVAKSDDISTLPYETRKETVEWIKQVTDPSMPVSIRTLKGVLTAREACHFEDDISGWERDALAVFDLNYDKYLIWQMREDMDMPVEEQIETFKEKTGRSRGYYYDQLSSIKAARD